MCEGLAHEAPMTRSITTYSSLRRWTSDEAREVLAAQQASGLSVAAFADQMGINSQRLYVWRRQLSAEGGCVPAFVEVTTAVAERMEVVLRSGRVVRVPYSFEPESLRRLLDVLEPPDSC